MTTKKMQEMLATGKTLGDAYNLWIDKTRDAQKSADRAYAEFALWAYHAEVMGIELLQIGLCLGRHATQVGHMQAVGMLIQVTLGGDIDHFLRHFHTGDGAIETKGSGYNVAPVGTKGQQSLHGKVSAPGSGKKRLVEMIEDGKSAIAIINSLFERPAASPELAKAVKSAVRALDKVQTAIDAKQMPDQKTIDEFKSLVDHANNLLPMLTASEYQIISA